MSFYQSCDVVEYQNETTKNIEPTIGINKNADLSKLSCKTYTIEKDEHYRPDKVSASIYDGRSDLDWALVNANKFTHEFKDFYVGRTIIYPTINELDRLGLT